MPWRGARAWAVAVTVFLSWLAAPTPAGAAGGDLFDRGKRWCATTHPNHGTLDGYGPALDLGSPDDYRWPVYAPGTGRVKIHSTGWGGGWGNSIIWISGDDRERIHIAHLDSFGATGRVKAGELIGRVGSTGRATSPHVHASARRDGKPASLILGGRVIEVDHCYTSRGPIPPLCLGAEATLVGTGRADVIVGTPGDDVLVGRAGADRIRGRGGNDRICGGRGADVLLGGRGADLIAGGRGPDLIRGGGGGDGLEGGPGRDELFGGPGKDGLSGGTGWDRLAGGRGADALDGGPGIDLASHAGAASGVLVDLGLGTASGEGSDVLSGIENVEGSAHDDVLTGDAGPNALLGLAGNDFLGGGGGDDFLDGGEGEDHADGGEGTDECLAEVEERCEEPEEP